MPRLSPESIGSTGQSLRSPLPGAQEMNGSAPSHVGRRLGPVERAAVVAVNGARVAAAVVAPELFPLDSSYEAPEPSTSRRHVQAGRNRTTSPVKRVLTALGLSAALALGAVGAGVAIHEVGNTLWPIPAGAHPNPTPGEHP